MVFLAFATFRELSSFEVFEYSVVYLLGVGIVAEGGFAYKPVYGCRRTARLKVEYL